VSDITLLIMLIGWARYVIHSESKSTSTKPRIHLVFVLDKSRQVRRACQPGAVLYSLTPVVVFSRSHWLHVLEINDFENKNWFLLASCFAVVSHTLRLLIPRDSKGMHPGSGG
jgi:hypothetical protein